MLVAQEQKNNKENKNEINKCPQKIETSNGVPENPKGFQSLSL